MKHWDEFDFVVVNDDFERALANLRAVVAGQGSPFRRERVELAALMTTLLD
jgi:guanylate kinase